MGRMSDAELAARITAATNHPFHEALGTFTDQKAALVEDVSLIRAYGSLVHRDKVRGFLYDLNAETLNEVAGL